MIARVVFDCMVFLQGAGRPASPARACFRLLDEGRIELFVSTEIFDEVRDVLTRPKTLRKFPLLTPEWTSKFLQNVESKSALVASVPEACQLPRDPKDEPYVNLAIAVSAQFLVSRDKDLLELMNDPDFCSRFPTLRILDPAAFLVAMADEGRPNP